MIHRSTFRIVGVAVLLLLIVVFARNLRSRVPPTADLGPRKVELIDVPVPNDVQGPYGMKMCLAPGGATFAIAGSISEPPTIRNPGYLFFAETLPPGEQARLKAFEKRLYFATADQTPPIRDLLTQNRRMCAVLAMAISPSKPFQLAYVMRESNFELPANLGRMTPDDLRAFTSRVASPALREVLYVSVSNGPPKAVLTLTEGIDIKSDLLYRRLNVGSLCWTHDGGAVVYSDGESVSRISPSGERTTLYRFEKNRFLASHLAADPGGTISFIDFFFIQGQSNGPSQPTSPVWLVTVDQNGSVVDRKEWRTFTFGSFIPSEWYSLAVLGRTKWAFLDTSRPGTTGRLYVGSRTVLQTPMEAYELDGGREKSIAPCYTLYAFSPGDREIWLSQTTPFWIHGSGDPVGQSSGYPFVELKKIRLRGS